MQSFVLDERQGLPFVIEAEDGRTGGDLASAWDEMREQAGAALTAHGAVLFRGFNIDSQECFSRLVRTVSGELSSYVDGNSPRTKLDGGVYTSTEYPPEYFISLHNELSYAARWPSRLLFCCVIAAERGGATALASSRAILRALDPSLADEFRRKQVRYIRNLRGDRRFGQSWQQTFETGDRAAVESILAGSGSEWEWKPDGSLRVESVRPATARHPQTGEEVWFNQADQFHPSTHPPEVYDMMKVVYEDREDELPQNATFGDGSPLPESALRHIREITAAHIVDCNWRPGDFLALDNMLVAHGRQPFEGKRKVLVAMSGGISWQDCGHALEAALPAIV